MIEILLALSAGLISFLSPCVLPLIPGYISYVSGSSLNELLEKKKINLFPIILFTIGFSIVFISFGATASFLGSIILDNSYELRVIAGILVIIFSLQILGIINLKFLNYEKRIQTKKNTNNFPFFGGGFVYYLAGKLPNVDQISTYIPSETTKIYAKDMLV